MNRFESRLGLTELKAALTIVIDNDIIVPSIEQSEAVLVDTRIYGYIWRYKNCGVRVDLSSIASAEILEHNKLYIYIEATRAYVKGELHRLMGGEVKNNAM
jgi:hypothetical protein